MSKTSGSSFGELDFGVDSFQHAIGYPFIKISCNAAPM
jgi:hypothetical protein